jgi:hypothetical protein
MSGYVDLRGMNRREQPAIDLPSSPPGGQTVTAHSQDDALTLATASLRYSRAYIVVFAVVILALLAIAWVVVRDDAMLAVLIVVGVLAWGWSSYGILAYERVKGLENSPSGIALAEIESRERLSMYAIDKHIYILERQWEREDGPDTVRSLPGN